MSANPSQLFLLADHIKLSLLERHRSQVISPSSNSTQDASIARSLTSFLDGLEALETEVTTTPDSTLQDQASQLRKQYTELEAQFKQSTQKAANSNPAVTHPNDPSLSDDFAHAASSKSRGQQQRRGRAPYKDEPEDEGVQNERRGELFRDRYRDEPEPPIDPAVDGLDNQQIHAQHSQILADQDEQLDQLGVSIGRQRELSMRIGDELDEQVAMLEDVEEGVDRHQGRLDGARDRLGRFARKASKVDWSWYVIGGLILVLVLLILILK